MRAHCRLLFATPLFVCAFTASPSAAQQPEQAPVPCRDLPCAVVVDWTRAGGVANQTPDRRYGNPTHLEETLKARLTERGFARNSSTDGQDLRFQLTPIVRNAMCDQMSGTATDMSCRAISELEVRVEGPEVVTRNVDIPSRIRNRCSSDQVMPVDKLAVFIADWIIYALEGRVKGERRPVGRC